jgi:hypothetical protein
MRIRDIFLSPRAITSWKTKLKIDLYLGMAKQCTKYQKNIWKHEQKKCGTLIYRTDWQTDSKPRVPVDFVSRGLIKSPKKLVCWNNIGCKLIALEIQWKAIQWRVLGISFTTDLCRQKYWISNETTDNLLIR